MKKLVFYQVPKERAEQLNKEYVEWKNETLCNRLDVIRKELTELFGDAQYWDIGALGKNENELGLSIESMYYSVKALHKMVTGGRI